MSTGLIDVHAHFLPQSYRVAAADAGHEEPDGFAHLPTWRAADHVDVMNRLGIATSMLSVSSPGVHFGDDHTARELAREVNEQVGAPWSIIPAASGSLRRCRFPTSRAQSQRSLIATTNSA